MLRARAGDRPAHRITPDLHEAAARCFVNDAAQRVEQAARSALAAMAEGDALRTLLAALRRVLKVTPVNTVDLRRRLADATVEQGRYILRSDDSTRCLVALALASFAACSSGPTPPDDAAYAELAGRRRVAVKDRQFR